MQPNPQASTPLNCGRETAVQINPQQNRENPGVSQEFIRHVPPVRRTTRTHGERWQDREARRIFAASASEYSLGEPVEIRVPCTCKAKPHPHPWHQRGEI